MSLKEKYEAAKDNVKMKWENFKVDMKNPEKVANAITIIGGVATVGWTVMSKFGPSKTERRDRKMEKSYYDPHTGVRWDLKKKLNNNQKSELVTRQQRGERTDDILDDMGVLK